MVRHPVYTPLTTADGPSYNGTLYFLITLMDLGRSRERLWPPETYREQTFKMPVKLRTLSLETCCLHWDSNMQEECINRWLGKWILLQQNFSASLHNMLCTITYVMSYYFLNLNVYSQIMIFQSSHVISFKRQRVNRSWCGVRGAQVGTDDYWTPSWQIITKQTEEKRKTLINPKDLLKSSNLSLTQSLVYRPLKWLK